MDDLFEGSGDLLVKLLCEGAFVKEVRVFKILWVILGLDIIFVLT